MVIYSENAAQEEVENVVKRTEHTMLTNFFALNQKLFDQQDPSALKSWGTTLGNLLNKSTLRES